MIAATVKATKDRYELAAELEAQGIAVDWNAEGGPQFKQRLDFHYDALAKVFRVVHRP